MIQIRKHKVHHSGANLTAVLGVVGQLHVGDEQVVLACHRSTEVKVSRSIIGQHVKVIIAELIELYIHG